MKTNDELIKSHISTIILKCLESGEKYGYEILKYIKEKSQGAIEIKQPTLYSSLRRLENIEMISSFWKNSEIGGRRHYYELTEKGKTEIAKSKTDWLKSKQILNHFITESESPFAEIKNIENANSFENLTTENLQTENLNGKTLNLTDKTLQCEDIANVNECFEQPAPQIFGAAALSSPATTPATQPVLDQSATLLGENKVLNFTSFNKAQTQEKQIDFFEDEKKLAKKTQTFKQAMAELKTSKENAEIFENTVTANEIADIQNADNCIETTQPQVLTTQITKQQTTTKQLLNEKNSLKNFADLPDDGVFYNQNQIIAEQNEIKKQPPKKEIKNDAVFITERTLGAVHSPLFDEHTVSELTKSYDENELDLQINYVASPLFISEDEILSSKALENKKLSIEKTTTERNYPISVYNNYSSADKNGSKFVNASKINLFSAAAVLLVVMLQFIILSQKNIFSELKTDFSSSILACYVVFGALFFVAVLIKFFTNINLKKQKKNAVQILYGFLFAFVFFAVASLAVNLFKPEEFFVNGFNFTTVVMIFACADFVIYFLIKTLLASLKSFNA